MEIYTGSLRKALKSYALSGDVDFIVMRPGIVLRMASPLWEAVCFWRIIGTAGESWASSLHSARCTRHALISASRRCREIIRGHV